MTRCGLTASWKALAPLGQSVPSLIGLSGSPSMSMSLPALGVDELAAADGAVGTDRSR